MREAARRFEEASASRRTYVYRQSVRSSLVKTGGEIIGRQHREYTVAPGETHTVKTLTRSEAFYRKGKKIFRYKDPEDKSVPEAMDRELLDDLTEDLVEDKKSRDGIPKQLFPLSKAELEYYTFHLEGEGTHEGRRYYRIGFQPRVQETCIHIGKEEDEKEESCRSRPWKGEVWLDAEDLQPLRVATELNRKIPAAIRLFLGTNIGQLGFSVTYKRVAPNIWFPATYGTEFSLRLLWGYRRTIALALESSDFRATAVQSNIRYETELH